MTPTNSFFLKDDLDESGNGEDESGEGGSDEGSTVEGSVEGEGGDDSNGKIFKLTCLIF